MNAIPITSATSRDLASTPAISISSGWLVGDNEEDIRAHKYIIQQEQLCRKIRTSSRPYY